MKIVAALIVFAALMLLSANIHYSLGRLATAIEALEPKDDRDDVPRQAKTQVPYCDMDVRIALKVGVELDTESNTIKPLYLYTWKRMWQPCSLLDRYEKV